MVIFKSIRMFLIIAIAIFSIAFSSCLLIRPSSTPSPGTPDDPTTGSSPTFSPEQMKEQSIQEKLDSSEVMDGAYRMYNGYLLPDSLQNSSDTYLYDKGVLEKQTIGTSTISFMTNWDGEKAISLEYIKSSNGNVVLPCISEDSSCAFADLKGEPIDLIEYNLSIYSVDIMKGILNPLLLEDDEYSKDFVDNAVKGISAEDFQLVWGTNPQPNLHGDRFTYFSNRNALKGGESKGGELRLKNMDTGADSSLGEIGFECLGWDKNDQVYYSSFNHDIVAIDTNDGSVRTILSDADPDSVLLYPAILSAKSIIGFDVYNMETRTTRTITNEQLADINILAGNPGGTAVLFENSFYPPGADIQKAPAINIGICSLLDGTIRLFDLPGDCSYQGCFWVEDGFIALILKKNDSGEVHTYLLETSLFTENE